MKGEEWRVWCVWREQICGSSWRWGSLGPDFKGWQEETPKKLEIKLRRHRWNVFGYWESEALISWVHPWVYYWRFPESLLEFQGRSNLREVHEFYAKCGNLILCLCWQEMAAQPGLWKIEAQESGVMGESSQCAVHVLAVTWSQPEPSCY